MYHGKELMVVKLQLVSHLKIENEATPLLTSRCAVSIPWTLGLILSSFLDLKSSDFSHVEDIFLY